MDEAGFLAEAVGDGAQEGVEVVVHFALVFGPALGVVAGPADLLDVTSGDDAALRPGLADGDLNLEPLVELVFVGPDAGDAGAGVAGNHGVRRQ